MNNKVSRTKNVLSNISSSFLSQFATQIFAFVTRTIFIKVLSVEYLGVNGLFANILSMLSIAELGVGAAIVYSMYKPMADMDETEIKSYLKLYKSVYRVIGIFIIVVGVSLTPFLDFFIEETPTYINVELIYIIFLIRTSSTYFFAYKQSVFAASQRMYIKNLYMMVFTILKSIFEIAFLLITREYIWYLLVSVITTYAMNIALAIKANKDYPFIKDTNSIIVQKEKKRDLYKNTKALFMHKISPVIISSADNLILSKFLGLATVGLYSNYSLIIIIVRKVFYNIFDGIMPSVGNLCAVEENNGKVYSVLKLVILLNAWIGGFCSVSLLTLLNPFIDLWIGQEYILDSFIVFSIVLTFYIQTSMSAVGLFRTANGLFYNDRYFALAQCVINIVASIVLLQFMGMAGVFIGTSFSILVTLFWVQPYLVYKKVLNKNPIIYFLHYSKYFLISAISFVLIRFLSTLITTTPIISFAYLMVCCVVVYNVLFILVCFKTAEFKDLMTRIKDIMKKKDK